MDFGYEQEKLFDCFRLEVKQGEFLGIIGPNGAGKSTLLRLIAGLLKPEKGRINLLGHDLNKISRKQIARIAAVVPQESFFAFDYTVEDIVMMGRNPYLGRLQQPASVDYDKVNNVLEFVDAAVLRHKGINEISGGEKQRVVLARALAQEPELLLLDEATSHLDISHQHSILRILAQLNNQGKTIVFLSHDLNLAALSCSRILLLHHGRQVACDCPERVITPELIKSVYGIEPLLLRHPKTGRPQVMLPSPILPKSIP